MSTHVRFLIALVIGLFVAGSEVGVGAVGTVFTYQGRLNAAGSPVSAAADFRFSLWTAVSGGSQVGTTQTLTSVAVQNGFFTVELDFGAAAFNGDARWLRIEVRHPAGAGSYQALSPRQPVLATPYAMTALKALEATSSTSMAWSGLTGLPAGFADGLDNDTLYSAGTGLTLAGSTFSIGAGGVATAMLADSAVTAAKLANSAVTSPKLADGAVGQGKLSALGGVAGQVLGTDGANLLWIWQTGGGSLILPYSGEHTGAGTAFAINSTVGEAIFGQSGQGHGIRGMTLGPAVAGVLGSATAGTGVRGESVDGAGVFGQSTNGYAGQFDGHVLVQGRGGFDSLGDTATLYLGKEPHYIRAEWGQGVRIGSYQAADAIALQQVTGNVGLGTTTPQARLDVNGNLIVRGFITRLEGGDFEIAHAPRGDGGRALVHEGDGTQERLVVNFDNDFANGTRIDGNVGIGTNPQARLDVAGPVTVSAQEQWMAGLSVTQKAAGPATGPGVYAETSGSKPAVMARYGPESSGGLLGTSAAYAAIDGRSDAPEYPMGVMGSAYDTDASNGLNGWGVLGWFSPRDVLAINEGSLGTADAGVHGVQRGTTGGGAGVLGVSTLENGIGVLGIATNGTNSAGVYAYSESGDAVFGHSNSGNAVFGHSNSGNAVYGQSDSGDAVYGQSDSGDAIYGHSNSGHAGQFLGPVNVSANTEVNDSALNVIQAGVGRGVNVEVTGEGGPAALRARYGANASGGLECEAPWAAIDAVSYDEDEPRGLVATAWDTDASDGLDGAGVNGGFRCPGGMFNEGLLGTPTDGVYGEQNYTTHAGTASFSHGAGVYGVSTIENGVGVVGEANNGIYAFGVYGYSTTGYAGFFSGKVHVDGALSAATKLFKIDHPLDSENKYLSHASVESSEMKTLYDGVTVTDARGYATIELPSWFEALNRDFRYQLTVVDDADSEEWVLAKVTEEIADNQFTIRTSAPATKVCWQVTGVRHDAWAQAHPLEVEQEKAAPERGLYLSPAEHGQPQEKAIHAARRESRHE